MQTFNRETATVALAGEGVDVRTAEAGPMTVGFFTLPAGLDMHPLMIGLQGDACQCPHWGMMLKGVVRMHTPDGPLEFRAGDVFHWAAGHVPEIVEDAQYIDFSPTSELHAVLEHVKSRAEAAATTG